MQPKTIQVGAQTVAYYESSGKGPAALLVHGNSSSARAFQRQIESSVGEEFRLVAIDLPGHGQSAPASDPDAVYSAPGYTEIVVQTAEKLGLQSAVFVGWSLGGHIVIEASDQLPKAAGFMVFGTPPLDLPPNIAEAFLPNPVMGLGFKPDLSEEEAEAYASAFFAPGFDDIPSFFKEDVLRTDGRARGALGVSIGQGRIKDEVEIVANLTAPLAVLHGAHEQLVNGDYIRGLTMPTLWRGAVQVIPDAGHAPQWEQAERFNALLAAFLSDAAG
ncbi:MAG: alpha/beta hydrolase [Chloroflexi bacterium]|nr:alpha/beta hydrolase [Chloroflexota bacterium]